MIHNGHLVHPDIWMLWYSFVVSAVNSLMVSYILLTRRGR